MEKADEISDKYNTSETSNLESVSSSYNTISENAESKVNTKTSEKNKNNDRSGLECHDGPNVSDDAANDTRLRNVQEKSSHSSDEYENTKVSVVNQKKDVDGGNLPEEPVKPQEQGLEEENNSDDSDESDVVEHDVKVCDICGDAGREDLLAICCRCPDGAEHTYCMKVVVDRVPEGDWFCEECKLDEENKKTKRQKYSTETGAEKNQSFDQADKDFSVVKISGKRRAEELESCSSFKKQALETITGSTKVVDRGKMKSSHQFNNGSLFGNESTEAAHSPVTRPRSQSLKGAFSKSNSFSFPNARTKTKLVDEIVFQRQKSTKEHSSHEAKELGKSSSFRSSNLGGFNQTGSKVKMLSPKSSHFQDIKSLKNKKERSFERTNSVKLSGSNSVKSRGETTSVSSGSNSEVKALKTDGKTISGLKSNSRSANLGAEIPVSLGPVNKQSPSSPARVGTAPTGTIISSIEQKSTAFKDDNPSKPSISIESTNLADVIKETTTSTHSAQGQFGNKPSSTTRSAKEVKNGDNKLKDAIEAALLKKPGIYRKNRVSDQPDESSAEVASDLQGQISRVDHCKHSNGNSFKQSMILPVEGKHVTSGLVNYDDVALSSFSKNSAIPDHECVWQGCFEINRSGKTAEFWDGLQAHLSSCASPRAFEAVNNLPHKILLNGVSRVSAWPSQFENSGVKEDNIAIYFFAKDVESYEKSYQVLLDDMIRGDLALIGSINGVELLIFPSNQLPERSNRWNMLFFLWGVFRGKKKNSLQVRDGPEQICIPQVVSAISTDKISTAEDACLHESTNKDKDVDSESKGNSKLQTFSLETNNSVRVLPAVTGENTSAPTKNDMYGQKSNFENEPKKRAFIDLSEDDDEIPTTNQNDTWRDISGRMTEKENANKKQKNDVYGQNSNLGERYFFPLIGSSESQSKVKLALDLNEDISCLGGETDGIIMTKNDDEDDDVASSLSLSLAFTPREKDDEDRGKGKGHSGNCMLLFRDMVDK